MPWLGLTFVLPLAGVIDSAAPPAAAFVAPGLAFAPAPVLGVAPPEQAVVTRARTQPVAATASQRWRPCGPDQRCRRAVEGEGARPPTSVPPTADQRRFMQLWNAWARTGLTARFVVGPPGRHRPPGG